MLLYDPSTKPRWIIERMCVRVVNRAASDPVWIETAFQWLYEGDVFRVRGNPHVFVAQADAEKLTRQVWGVRVSTTAQDKGQGAA